MNFRIVADDLHTMQKQLEVFTERQIEVMSKSLEATIKRLKDLDKAFFPPQPPKAQYFYGDGGGGFAGAVFRLICSDGKADRLIMATKLLDKRIRDIRKGRERLEGLCGDLAYEISSAVKLIERVRPVRKRLRIESCARVLMDRKLPEELVGIITGFAFEPRPCPPEPSSVCLPTIGGPTLQDIERTHMLYLNAHFRPYGAREMPFGVVLPPMGDFMRDMVDYAGRATPLSEYYRKRQARIELLRERERAKNARKKRNRRNRVRRQLVQLAHVLPGALADHVGGFLMAY